MSDNHYRYVGIGDTRTALAAIVCEGGVPVDLRGLTATFAAMNAEKLTEVIEEDGTFVTVEPSFVVTVSTSSGKFGAYGTGLKANDLVRFTADTMPTGLDEDAFYTVRNAYADGFTVTTCDGNSVVVPTTAGTNVECVIVGLVTYAWQAADVETAQKLDCLFRIVESGAKDTFPRSHKLIVEVRE